MRQAVLSFNGKDVVIKFPTVREFLSIESNKISLSKDLYGGLIMSRTIASNIALDLIDMVSVLKVMCPNIESDLGLKDSIKSLLDIDMEDIKPLVVAYNESIKPFTMTWIESYKSLMEESYGKSVKNTEKSNKGSKSSSE